MGWRSSKRRSGNSQTPSKSRAAPAPDFAGIATFLSDFKFIYFLSSIVGLSFEAGRGYLETSIVYRAQGHTAAA